MASPSPYTKLRRSSVAAPPSPSSKGGFFYKSILFALFLLALPLFPSQAPEFVGETVLTKFWELIHLLFVGIAVAYGLFSRRSVESRTSRVVVDESSLSYVSRIFHVSSVFDEDSCDFRSDESRLIHVSAQGSVVANETSELSEYGNVNQVQAWNSQYFQGRSKVVVARPAYGLDGHVVHRPLGLPVRSLRSGLRDNNAAFVNSSCDEAVDEKVEESLDDKDFDEVMAAPPSPSLVVPWHSRSEMMAMGDNYLSNFHPLSVDETHFATLESRSSRSTVSSSSSSSRTSFESHSQNRVQPSRSVSEESLDSNVDELVKEKSLEDSSRSSSPSLPPSPPPLVTDDDTHRGVLHSQHYSDGSLLEEDVRQAVEDEVQRSEVKTEIFSKKELGSKSLKLTAESSRKGKNKSRRSYPPDPISSSASGVSGVDDSTTRRRDLHHKSDDRLFEDKIMKRLESDHNKLRVKKGRSHESLELTAEVSSLTIPAVDVQFQPMNDKSSRRAMRSSRGSRDALPVKDIKRNSEDDLVDLSKSGEKELPGDNKVLKLNSPRCETQSRHGKDLKTDMKHKLNSPRASSKVLSRGKSVRTIRSDRHVKDLKTDGVSSHDQTEPKAESLERTKPRRQWQQELAIVLHQEKLSEETHPKSEPEDNDDVTEETEVEQLQLTLEEEEAAAAWESQSNASHDHYEVDRKADEFIAKFREQIRLQKLHSGEQPRGGGSIGTIRNSHFR